MHRNNISPFFVKISADFRTHKAHERQYNTPTGGGLNEIAIIMNYETGHYRPHLVVKLRDVNIKLINETNRSLEQLRFILFL